MASAKVMQLFQEENQRSLNPTCTGTSVFAIAFDKGVVIAADRLASYGKTARYKGVSRMCKVNNRTLVAFSGDHADFQYIQNELDQHSFRYKKDCGDVKAELSPKAIHGFLTSLLYYRRCKMNPLYNTLVVAGLQTDFDFGASTGSKPFIGVVNMRGVAYNANFAATGLGAMTIQHLLEKEYRDSTDDSNEPKLSKDQATALLKKCVELTYYRDCVSHNEFEVGTVSPEGVNITDPEKFVGNWEIAEFNCQYE